MDGIGAKDGQRGECVIDSIQLYSQQRKRVL
jgi:hypothetical protein